MKIIINSCERGIGRVPAIRCTLERYWPNHPEVIVLGYTSPDFDLGEGYTFISMAKEDRGARYWAPDQVNFFSEYEDEYFINWLDDYLLLREADGDMIEYYSELIKNKDIFDKIDLIHLGGSHSIEKSHWEEVWYDKYKYPIATLKSGQKFNLSLHPSLWRTSSYLQALLMATRKGADVWQFEKRINKKGIFNIVVPIGGNDENIGSGGASNYLWEYNIPLYISEIFKGADNYHEKTGRGCELCSWPDGVRGHKFTSKYKYNGEFFDTEKETQSSVIKEMSKTCSTLNCPIREK